MTRCTHRWWALNAAVENLLRQYNRTADSLSFWILFRPTSCLLLVVLFRQTKIEIITIMNIATRRGEELRIMFVGQRPSFLSLVKLNVSSSLCLVLFVCSPSLRGNENIVVVVLHFIFFYSFVLFVETIFFLFLYLWFAESRSSSSPCCTLWGTCRSPPLSHRLPMSLSLCRFVASVFLFAYRLRWRRRREEEEDKKTQKKNKSD